MDARATVRVLAEALARRARYGFSGEKPIAIWAMALVACEQGLGVSGHELLRQHAVQVRERFLRLADHYGCMRDARASWSVITGASQELQHALASASDADDAFAHLDASDAQALDEWFCQRVRFEGITTTETATPRREARPHPDVESTTRKAWHIQIDDAGQTVEGWSTFRIPFEPHDVQLAYRQELRRVLDALQAEQPSFLDAQYVSPTLPEGCDVENVLFYNVGTGVFRHLARDGLSFGYQAASPPPAPDGQQYDHYVQYSTANTAASAAEWETAGPPVTELPFIPINRLSSESKPWAIWRDVHRHLDAIEFTGKAKRIEGYYAIDVQLTLAPGLSMNIAAILKPLFDGLVSSFQRPATVALDLLQLVAKQTAEDTDTIRRWLTRAGPALLSSACPVETYRGSVRWDPDDHRLRAGRVCVIHGATSSPSLRVGLLAIP